MKEANYKPPKVEKYDCPACGEQMKVSFGSPVESICDDCKQAFLRNHEQDQLENCPFCNAGRDCLRHGLFVPYFYGTEGVMVVCKECDFSKAFESLDKKIKQLKAKNKDLQAQNELLKKRIDILTNYNF